MVNERDSTASNNFVKANLPPPHDINIEKAVLGSMLLDEDARNIAVTRITKPGSFYYPPHQKIFNCISFLYQSGKRSIDILSVANALKNEGVLDDIGGDAYLLELQYATATSANIEEWCSILNNLTSLRKMISVCATTINKCYDADTESISDILGEVESSIFEVRDVNKTCGATLVGEHIVEAVQHLEKLHKNEIGATGLSTGLPSLDNIILGLRPQEMIVIAARPSIGKTSLALNITSHLGVTKGKNIVFFSLEMSSEQLTRRLLCSLAKVSERDFYDKRFDNEEFGRKWGKITGAASELSNSKIYIDPTPGLSIGELKAKAIRLKAKHNIDVIIIDYLQLMRADVGRNDNRQVEVAKISVGVKGLAKELNVPVIVLAQLNRQAEQQDKPKLSHLRESGAIEQDADIVMFLHRDRDPQKDIMQESVEAELIVEKNRNGQTGSAKLLFFPKITTFVSPSRDAGT